MTPWILKDFRSARRTLPHIEDYFNRKGLVSDLGEKKKAFFVLQKYYRGLQSAQTIQIWPEKEDGFRMAISGVGGVCEDLFYCPVSKLSISAVAGH
jgi:hypothetical protein